jgi:F plasmid transfer operon protein
MRPLALGLILFFSNSFSHAHQAPAPRHVENKLATHDPSITRKTERGPRQLEKNSLKVEGMEVPPAAYGKERPQLDEKVPSEDLCRDAPTWSVDCGFVDPGADFDFQAKQRDALLAQMTEGKNDPNAREQFEHYMRWVIDRASEVTNLWLFNMTQNAEGTSQPKQPLSTSGVPTPSKAQKDAENEVFEVIKQEGGMLVFFTTTDCVVCHGMALGLQRIARDSGVTVRNASLDANCMDAFKDGCLAGEDVHIAATALQVGEVPSVYLYLAPRTWLRVAAGVVSEDIMRSRILAFVSAYRAAPLKGANNVPTGRSSAIGDKSKSIRQNDIRVRLPSEDDIARMLGKK